MRLTQTTRESGDCAPTFIDSFRYLEQLGRLAKKGVQVVMHNTHARSEYALPDHDMHNPRPNYWSALLWNKFMGTQVYDVGTLSPGVDNFTHNWNNNNDGRAVLILNTNDTAAQISIPANREQYLLTPDELLTNKVNSTEQNFRFIRKMKFRLLKVRRETPVTRKYHNIALYILLTRNLL